MIDFNIPNQIAPEVNVFDTTLSQLYTAQGAIAQAETARKQAASKKPRFEFDPTGGPNGAASQESLFSTVTNAITSVLGG